MTKRKPDFYVVKREGLDGIPEWFTFDADGHVWDYQLMLRHRFVTEADAAKIAKKYGGSVTPVCCTSKRAEPKMRERSSAWVLKRLAEGKVLYRPRHEAGSLMFSETLIRWEPVDGMIEFCVPGEMVWSSKRGQLCFDGKILCRIARPSEVPQ